MLFIYIGLLSVIILVIIAIIISEGSLNNLEFVSALLLFLMLLFGISMNNEYKEKMLAHIQRETFITASEEGTKTEEESVISEEYSTKFHKFDFMSYNNLVKLPSEARSIMFPPLDYVIKAMTVGVEAEDDGVHFDPETLYEMNSDYFVKTNDPVCVKDGNIDDDAFESLKTDYLDCNFAIYQLKLYNPVMYENIFKT